MNILTITNLYPRPDQPQRGLFNAQVFTALHAVDGVDVQNICLVPEWRIWRWKKIRGWSDDSTFYLPVFYLPVIGRNISWWTYGWGMTENVGAKALLPSGLRKERGFKTDADVVLATWLYPDCVAACGLARQYGKPIWFKVQGSDVMHLENQVRRRKILEACEYATGIICVSSSLAETLKSAGVEEKKVFVVPNGVDGEMFHYRSKEDAREELRRRGAECVDDIVAKKKIVLFVGNLVHVKGVDLLVRAWGRGRRAEEKTPAVLGQQKAPDPKLGGSLCCSGEEGREKSVKIREVGGAVLVVIGEGKMRGRLERMVKRLGIEDTVVFMGVRLHDEVALWMNVADCLCLPSRAEGMPNVLLEAVASGLPVVATDVGGSAEVIMNREDCRLVEVCDRDENTIRNISEALMDGEKKLTTKIAKGTKGEAGTWTDTAREMLKLMEGG